MHSQGARSNADATGDGSSVPHSEPAGSPPEAIQQKGRLRRWLDSLGPGLITGAADDDPSGISTYSVAGAAFGFATLWTAIVTLPLMSVVQYICHKIAMVTGMGLAGVLRQHYPRWVLYPAILGLVLANTINVGTDIAAIAAGINLVVPIPIRLLIVPIALAIVALQIWGQYRTIVRIFKWLTLSLFAYIAAAFLANPSWPEALRSTFIPELHFDHEYLTTVLAILGTTISPYLFFWQASQEVEQEVSNGKMTREQRIGASDEDLGRARMDTVTGMFFCNLIFYFVIVACAATLHVTGNTEIKSAADAAEALRPVAGSFATYLFAIGIIGAGFLAVPVLSGSSAYAIAETFGWKFGLDTKPWEARQFYTVIAVSTLIGIAIDFLNINPISALFWTAVINGVIAPPLLVLIMLAANNKRVMGRRVNGWFTNLIGWTATLVMFAAAVGVFAT
ncbi:MAG: divalent metal cation transporter [Betaproteobacteria bacterium]|nr:divalent metal cation transporter [Betaproteobacteria bacterium]